MHGSEVSAPVCIQIWTTPYCSVCGPRVEHWLPPKAPHVLKTYCPLLFATHTTFFHSANCGTASQLAHQVGFPYIALQGIVLAGFNYASVTNHPGRQDEILFECTLFPAAQLLDQTSVTGMSDLKGAEIYLIEGQDYHPAAHTAWNQPAFTEFYYLGSVFVCPSNMRFWFNELQ